MADWRQHGLHTYLLPQHPNNYKSNQSQEWFAWYRHCTAGFPPKRDCTCLQLHLQYISKPLLIEDNKQTIYRIEYHGLSYKLKPLPEGYPDLIEESHLLGMAPRDDPFNCMFSLCWPRKTLSLLSPNVEGYADDGPWPLPLSLESVWFLCALNHGSDPSCWTFEESKFPLLVLGKHSKLDLADWAESFASKVMLFSSEEFSSLSSCFFVLRKRPPQPLALLNACRCRDSWRYGCRMNTKSNIKQTLTLFTDNHSVSWIRLNTSWKVIRSFIYVKCVYLCVLTPLECECFLKPLEKLNGHTYMCVCMCVLTLLEKLSVCVNTARMWVFLKHLDKLNGHTYVCVCARTC